LAFTPTGFTGDTTHPALVISQGTLQLNNNVITVNNAASTALGAGTYRLIQVGNGTSGTISGTPNATPFVTGKGLAANTMASLSVSSGNVILTVATASPTATTTALGSLTTSTYGSPVTFTATVAPPPAGGSIQFYDNGVAIGSPVMVSSGTASYTTSALWAGNHSMTAAYSGASGYAASSTASASTQTVSAVALSITANADSKTYGQTKTYGSRSTAFTSAGLQNGDAIASVTITASGGTAANAPAASYNLTPSAAVGGAFNANNYIITYNSGTMTVNPALLSITASADSKTYGQTKAYGAGSTAFTSSGLQNGETIRSVTITDGGSGGLAAAAVGPYALTPSAATGGTFAASNYTISYHPATLTVGPAALDITANDAIKECSQSLTFAGTEFTTGVGQLLNGNTVTNVTLTSIGAVNGALTGTYDIVASAAEGSGLGNYSIAYHEGKLTVSDTTPPAITYYFTNMILSPTSSNCQAVLPDLTGTNYIIAVDGCGSLVTVTQSPPANTWLPLGTNEVVLTAIDPSGNVTNSTNAVIVADTTPPAIACPPDIPVVTTDPTGAYVSFTVAAVDACDPNPTIVTAPASGSLFLAGTNTVTCYAYDASGNTNTCSFLVMVDRAPIAHSDVSAYPLQNQLLSLELATLLAVVSDPDNDPLSVATAGPASTNGGTVTLTSTSVTYQPVADFVGPDLFYYTVSDGRGGLATNTVAVTVVSSNGLSPQVVYGPLVSDGQFIVRFAGIPSYTYTVEATDDLRLNAWSKKANLTAPVTDQGLGIGVFEFGEMLGTTTHRYYRTVYPPY
jgi:hypothetical protein